MMLGKFVIKLAVFWVGLLFSKIELDYYDYYYRIEKDFLERMKYKFNKEA